MFTVPLNVLSKQVQLQLVEWQSPLQQPEQAPGGHSEQAQEDSTSFQQQPPMEKNVLDVPQLQSQVGAKSRCAPGLHSNVLSSFPDPSQSQNMEPSLLQISVFVLLKDQVV
jgi:hypothetical protein